VVKHRHTYIHTHRREKWGKQIHSPSYNMEHHTHKGEGETALAMRKPGREGEREDERFEQTREREREKEKKKEEEDEVLKATSINVKL